MHVLKWGVAIAVASILATSAFAQDKQTTTLASAAPATKESVKQYCTDLVTQFNGLDTHAVAAQTLADAKDHASRGEMLCGTMPKTGVKELWVAFRTVGVEPK